MRKSVLERPPLLCGLPVTFTHQEGAGFSPDDQFDVSLLHLKMAEKAIALLSHYGEAMGNGASNPDIPLKDFSVTKAPRRFWGDCPLGYHIIRLHFRRGMYRRTVSLRYLRDSENNFDGRIFNHPLRHMRVE